MVDKLKGKSQDLSSTKQAPMKAKPAGPFLNVFPPSVLSPSRSPREKQAIPRLDFILIEELDQQRDGGEEEAYNDGIGDVSVDLREWVRNDLKRQVANTEYSAQAAVPILIDKALMRFIARKQYEFWERLTKTVTSTVQSAETYKDKEDFTEVTKMCSTLIAPIETMGLGSKRRTVRLPIRLKDQLGATAETVGMDLSPFAQHMMIDGLRSQPDVIYAAEMDETTETLYYRFDKRLRRLVANLERVYSIDLVPEVQEIIDEIDEWGGL